MRQVGPELMTHLMDEEIVIDRWGNLMPFITWVMNLGCLTPIIAIEALFHCLHSGCHKGSYPAEHHGHTSEMKEVSVFTDPMMSHARRKRKRHFPNFQNVMVQYRVAQTDVHKKQPGALLKWRFLFLILGQGSSPEFHTSS